MTTEAVESTYIFKGRMTRTFKMSVFMNIVLPKE